MRLRMIMSLLALLTGGCFQDLFDAGAALSPNTDGSSSGSSSPPTSTGEPTPTTSWGPGVQTVTGPPEETSATTTTTAAEPETTTSAPEENAAPTVELDVHPHHLSEAGKALLQLVPSEDVVKVRLSLNGVELAELTPADFPYTYEALSAKDNGAPHVFDVVVEDEEGLTATDETELTVQLPATGAQKCLFEDKGAVESTISTLVYTETAIVAVGSRNKGGGRKAAIWKLDPDHCEVVLPGWPKTMADWTADPTLAAMMSRASAVAIDEVGNLAVGINLEKDNKPQRYVAFLTTGGSLLWEKLGKVGDEVAGVAVVPGGVVAVGSTRTSENPVRTDAAIWRHLEGGNFWPETLKAPFTPDEFDPDAPNERSEWARAVLYDAETDLLFVVGDREFMDNANNIYRRGFVARFVPLGNKYGPPWTSSGDPLLHSGTTSVARCGADILVGGWTQDEPPGSMPQPLTRWLDAQGAGSKRVVEQLPGTQAFGIACDREGKIVHAATRTSGPLDAQVFAFADPNEPRDWYDKGSSGNDAAVTIDCDARGFCAWGGFRTLQGKVVTVVRGHHP